jgi:hypothetical protein
MDQQSIRRDVSVDTPLIIGANPALMFAIKASNALLNAAGAQPQIAASQLLVMILNQRRLLAGVPIEPRAIAAEALRKAAGILPTMQQFKGKGKEKEKEVRAAVTVLLQIAETLERGGSADATTVVSAPAAASPELPVSLGVLATKFLNARAEVLLGYAATARDRGDFPKADQLTAVAAILKREELSPDQRRRAKPFARNQADLVIHALQENEDPSPQNEAAISEVRGLIHSLGMDLPGGPLSG